MKPFYNSSALVENPKLLREQFQNDGYVYLKSIISPEKILQLRAEILEIMSQHHWLKPEADPDKAIAWTTPKVEGEDDYFSVYDEIMKLESLHQLAHDENINAIMESLHGAPAFPHPLGIARLAFPHNNDWATPSHQDYPNNQGTKELYACWIPLGNYAENQGVLSILPGSHKLGLLPTNFSLGAGHRRAILGEDEQSSQWVSGGFFVGDLIIFHSLTVHKSLENATENMRISVDYRFQKEGDDLTEGCLSPHFGRLSWEEIYTGWHSKKHQYYWKDKQSNIVPYDSSLLGLPEEEIKKSFKERMLYDQKRKVLGEKFK